MQGARRFVFAASALLCLLAATPAPRDGTPPAEIHPPGYVGQVVCAGCHKAESAEWARSHHARAMAPASNPGATGGVFDGTTLGQGTGVARVFLRDGAPTVATAGPDGHPGEFPIAYSLGVAPLQQYLVALPGGKLQALPWARDMRQAAQGGQRWFSLYPDETIAPGDKLHWTSRAQNWNFMCASCHSTGSRKNYQPATDSYSTSWSDIAVACEACHGPGARHVAWAENGADRARVSLAGFTSRLDDPAGAGWGDYDPARSFIRHWRGVERGDAVIETCAPCHARRRQLTEAPVPGAPLLDGYEPSLLEPGLFGADGQIEGEVFEFGAFLQSKMHRNGVTCTDCHTPHGTALRAEGNALCAQCHAPAHFDTPSHHHHAAGGPGAQCVSCHMPTRIYMQVHVRHDHGFRVPRPDVTEALGTPNACAACHQDRDAAWATDALRSWFGPAGRNGAINPAAALTAGRDGRPGAAPALVNLAGASAAPGIVRATALSLLSGPLTAEAVRQGARDTDPLVRLGALRALEAIPPAGRVALAGPLLLDPARAVRITAARLLATVPLDDLPEAQRAARDAALREWIDAESEAADRPESHLNLGVLWGERGDLAAARREFGAALRLDGDFVPGLLDLADLCRVEAREEEAATLLETAAAKAPRNAEARYALGLSLIRRHRLEEALPALREAVRLSPGEPAYARTLELALRRSGAGR